MFYEILGNCLLLLRSSYEKVEGETVKVSKQEYSFEFLTVYFELNSNDKNSIHI